MYSSKVYRPEGGEELVVDDGGKITVKDGGAIVVEAGGSFDVESETVTAVEFDETYFKVDNGVVTLKDDVAALLSLIAGIPTTDPEDGESIWIDSGSLKIASQGA